MTTKKQPTIQPKIAIIIDQREKNSFVDGFKTKLESDEKTRHIQLSQETLPVGDILYKYGDKILIMIERKTLLDLNKSITDSRYKEQKIRIIDSEIPYKYYLVEGTLYKITSAREIPLKDYSKIYGAIIHTTIRDGIPVIRTENMEDTYQVLLKIYSTIEGFGAQLLDKFKTTPHAIDYVETLKSAKKDNMTPEVCYLTQLCQIPGVSTQIAQTIATKYPSFRQLIEQYNRECDTHKQEFLLKDLVLESNRKVGPVISKRIYEYLMK